MPSVPRRATIYLESALHRALKLKAVETDSSISELVNEAVRNSLAEDLEDLAAFEERKDERTIPFEEVLKELRRDGRL